MRRLLPLALLVLASCSHVKQETEPTSRMATPLAGPYWHLASLPNNTPLPPGLPPFLHFDPTSNRVTGHTGVNSLGGSYTADKTHVTLSKLFTTRMAAVDPARNALERDFLQALDTKPLSYTLTASTLKLGNLTFTAHDTRPAK